MLSIRLGNHHKDPLWLKEFLHIVKENPGCCDEVWIPSEYGFPPMEKHQKAVDPGREAAKLLRAARHSGFSADFQYRWTWAIYAGKRLYRLGIPRLSSKAYGRSGRNKSAAVLLLFRPGISGLHLSYGRPIRLPFAFLRVGGRRPASGISRPGKLGMLLPPMYGNLQSAVAAAFFPAGTGGSGQPRSRSMAQALDRICTPALLRFYLRPYKSDSRSISGQRDGLPISGRQRLWRKGRKLSV